MYPTKTLARYVCGAKYADFPSDVVEKAKYSILDSVGCALGGSQTDLGQLYIRLAKEMGGPPESTLIGDCAKISCINAAYTNTLLGNALDFDDTHLYVISHPGGPVIQSALAVAETVSISGKDLITAVIAGYEVSLRVGHSMRTILAENGRKRVLFNFSLNSIGAATSVGKLLGLDIEGLNSAFGIAGTIVTGSTKGIHRKGGPGRQGRKAKLNYHFHALFGTLAAWQASKGLEGPQDIFDGDIFWTRTGAETCSHIELTRGLGQSYRIMEVGFKPIPSCRLAQASITAIWKALAGEKINPANIKEIVLSQSMALAPSYEWETILEAQFSIPCVVAMSLAGGQEPGPAWFVTGRYLDPDIFELARRIRVVEDPEASDLWVRYGKLVSTAEVRMSDGTIRKAFIEYPKGEPENPCTKKELELKFMANAVGTIGENQSKEVLESILNLENIGEISTLMGLLHS